MARLENVIGAGPAADRPAAGTPGVIYCALDTKEVSRDNGATWDLVSTGNPTTLSGNDADKPDDADQGTFYLAYDTGILYIRFGASWTNIFPNVPSVEWQVFGVAAWSGSGAAAYGYPLMVISAETAVDWITLQYDAAHAPPIITIVNTNTAQSATIKADTGQHIVPSTSETYTLPAGHSVVFQFDMIDTWYVIAER